MNRSIRTSTTEDAHAFMGIKSQLRLNATVNADTNGGFLLGTDLPTYQFYINHGISMTAIVQQQAVGFGIVLPDVLVKKSELWEKRHAVDWEMDIKSLEKQNICYFEQLAFLKGHRILAMQLAFQLVQIAFDNGAEYLLTTTVAKPVRNKAAVPYILAAGGRKVGQIDESYPDVGEIQSDIYLITRSAFESKVKHHPLYPYLEGVPA